MDTIAKDDRQVNVYSRLKFVDTMNFMRTSLEKLVGNLEKPSFKHTGKYFRDEELDLMLRKGVYPYEYMTGVERLREKSLPPKEEFASLLGSGVISNSKAMITPSHISDEDYEHAQKLFEAFGCENLADYTGLYCKWNVLLLADVFESFIDVCLGKYGLDPSHYITAPAFSWDAMLKMTGVKLKLLTDSDMHLFFEEGIRGGISTITNRYARANHKYVEGYDPGEESVYIQYLDPNNLYGGAMSQPLPVEHFVWLDEDDIYTYTKHPERIRSCTLEVDLEYSKGLHDLHNDYPLAPETVTINDTKKLIPHLGNRKKYVLHHETLRQCLKYGMKLTKIHRGIRYTESKFLEKYIVSNTESRMVAKNEFEKDFFKLMNNSVFGKTMENVRDRSKIKTVNGQETEKLERLIARPNYRGSFVFENSELVSVSLGESKVTLNKPIYLGQAILDLSKTLMYEFHYGYVKPKYGDPARLLFTDTDSLCYRIQTEGFYEDIAEDVPKWFDTSSYLKGHPIGGANKKVLGMMKDEAGGRHVTEFVGLRSKLYAFKIEGYEDRCEREFCDGNCDDKGCIGNVGKKCKGVKKAVVKNSITLENYKDCLFGGVTHRAKFNTLRSRRYEITMECITKVALSANDDKRYVIPNDPEHRTLALGHHGINGLQEQQA